MSDAAKVIVERLPRLDGEFRRRVGAGIVLLATMLVVLVELAGINTESIAEWASTNSIGVIFALIALAYLLGGLVEVLATIYLGVFVGNIAWAIMAPLNWFTTRPKYVRYPARLLCWYPGAAILLVWAILRSLCGISDYDWHSIESSLGEHQLRVFHGLDSSTQRGLRRPFGSEHEAAWFDLYRQAADERTERRLVLLQSRNQEVLVTTAAVFLSAAVLAFSLDWSGLLGRLPFSGTTPEETPPLVSLLQLVTLGLLVGTVQIAHRTTRSALSILARTPTNASREALGNTGSS